MPTYIELSIIVVMATALAIVMKQLRQPLIVGYIATGILIGPYGFDILQSLDAVELFSKIGIAILLFIVGLSLNPDTAREVGKTSVIIGLGQVTITSALGFGLAQLLGFSTVASLYIAIALTFSSTIIVLKLLTDRGDTETLYGKIAVGLLLVQDLIATVLLAMVTVIGSLALQTQLDPSQAIITFGGMLLVKGFIAAIILYGVSKYILPHLAENLANNQEVLFMFSISWGLGLSAIFYALGFSIEIGALIAGVTLSVSPFAYEISSRLKPLRDFFITIFFVMLGAQMTLGSISAIIVPVVIFSIFVLVGNPIIMVVLMSLLGYRPRTSVMAALTVAQISEFSLILVALGAGLGHVDPAVLSVITLVGIITITGSTYLILYADPIYERVKTIVHRITPTHLRHATKLTQFGAAEIIVFGYDRVGRDFVTAAKKISKKYVVVDYDPQALKRLTHDQVPYRYGDAEDTVFLQEQLTHKAQLVVSTIPNFRTNLALVRYYRKRNKKGIIMVISHDVAHAKALYLAGASYVIMPHYLGAHHAALLIAKNKFDTRKFEAERNAHLLRLAARSSS